MFLNFGSRDLNKKITVKGIVSETSCFYEFGSLFFSFYPSVTEDFYMNFRPRIPKGKIKQ